MKVEAVTGDKRVARQRVRQKFIESEIKAPAQ